MSQTGDEEASNPPLSDSMPPNIHVYPHNSTVSTSRKRTRPGNEHVQKPQRRRIACQQCRRKKAKCDNVRPICGFCAAGSQRCVYMEPHGGNPKYEP